MSTIRSDFSVMIPSTVPGIHENWSISTTVLIMLMVVYRVYGDISCLWYISWVDDLKGQVTDKQESRSPRPSRPDLEDTIVIILKG